MTLSATVESEVHIERAVGDAHGPAAKLLERAVISQTHFVMLEAPAFDSGFTQTGEEQAVDAT